MYAAEWDPALRGVGGACFISNFFVKHILYTRLNCIAISAQRISKALKFIFEVNADAGWPKSRYTLIIQVYTIY